MSLKFAERLVILNNYADTLLARLYRTKIVRTPLSAVQSS